jgi:CopG family transcriptional regulator/antitoxin EndoAI
MEHKRISITLPEDILADIDSLSSEFNGSRSLAIESIIRLYLSERRRIEQKKNLMKGYAAMAEINLSIAEECFNSDQATQDAYEHFLMGCE